MKPEQQLAVLDDVLGSLLSGMTWEQHLAIFEDVARSLIAELGLTPAAAREIEQALAQLRTEKPASAAIKVFFDGRACALIQAAANATGARQ